MAKDNNKGNRLITTSSIQRTTAQGDKVINKRLLQEGMHAFTAILFFCFTDMILIKEIQSSKGFHLIKCSTEITRDMIDVSLKEVATNSTLLNYSPETNECTSYTSNAACFVERKGKGMFSTLKFYTDNIVGNISYVCVKTMLNMNGKMTLTTFTATITVDVRTVTTEPIKTTSNSPDRTVTTEPIKTTSNSTDITVTTEPIKTTSNSTDITVTTEPIKSTSNSTDITVTTEPIKTTSNSPDRTVRTVTTEPIKTTSNSPDITVTTEPIKTTSNSPDRTVSMATNPININVNPNTEDETTFYTVLIIIFVIIGTVIIVFIFVACVVFYRKLKRQGALNINTPAIGGVQSDNEDISNGQGAQISSGQFAQTTIGANSGTDLAINMELSQINHDGDPFPCQSEVSFQPTAVDDFGSSGTAVVLHPDPHVPECQNPAPARG